MASITAEISFPDYPGMTLPISTFSYPILRGCLTACGGNVELAAEVLNSYLVIASVQTCHTLMETDAPLQHLLHAAVSWEHVVEKMYDQVQGLTQGSIQESGLIFREVTESMRVVSNTEALRPLLEIVSYRGYLLPGYGVFIFEALRVHMQGSIFIHAIIQSWLVHQGSAQDSIEDSTPVRDEEMWENFEPAELTDVGFEASGPRLNVIDIATKTYLLKHPTCSACKENAETDDRCGHSTCNICLDRLDLTSTDMNKVPMEIRCGHGHSFHFECLDYLINGISDFSNLCPNCRVPICERRGRRPIVASNVVNDRVDAALAAEVSSSGDESEDEEMIDGEVEEEEDEMEHAD